MYHISCNENCHNDNEAAGNARKEVMLVFHREQLLYDIRNCAYIEGHVWGDGKEEIRHAQHTLIEIGEEGNIDRVNRILGLVHRSAIEMLYPYTKQEVREEDVICDRIREPEDYIIKMNVPDGMSGTTLYLLNDLIHEFMVARVIHDWLSITHPEAARNWLDKAEEAEREINIAKNRRRGMLRRRSHPF